MAKKTKKKTSTKTSTKKSSKKVAKRVNVTAKGKSFVVKRKFAETVGDKLMEGGSIAEEYDAAKHTAYKEKKVIYMCNKDGGVIREFSEETFTIE